jgi:hypothetical protein
MSAIRKKCLVYELYRPTIKVVQTWKKFVFVSFSFPFVCLMPGILRLVIFFSPFTQMLDHGHFHLFHLHHSYFIPPFSGVQRMQFAECSYRETKTMRKEFARQWSYRMFTIQFLSRLEQLIKRGISNTFRNEVSPSSLVVSVTIPCCGDSKFTFRLLDVWTSLHFILYRPILDWVWLGRNYKKNNHFHTYCVKYFASKLSQYSSSKINYKM